MGEIRMAAPVAGLADADRISADDVLLLRREVFADGLVSLAEADALFALDRSCTRKCDEWVVFFVEAISDFLVHQAEPQGYISDANAAWLIRAISHDGLVDGRTELEMLVQVLEKARSAPSALSAYALKQVAAAVIDGKGPLACGRELVPGIILRPEVDLLRRILNAGAGEGGLAISREEAEVLFDINDRTVEEMNDPAWNELYVKAIANFVLCASGYAAPTREEALAHDAFFDKADPDLGGFFARMVSGGVAGILDAYRKPVELEDIWAERNAKREAEAAAAEVVEEGEAEWLAERIGRDRLLHDNERELLGFLKRHSSSIHPALKPLLDKVA